eukprot:CAMPEP_0118932590 /NCGR_PEP_ID=MMETSP1169-20130426/10513_1 /TAXON_ID=36882 /ORGANISM="Pyramimonas obovata, Strain CCMP722" /LENGTH=246 /DNA_ID=CAMNT_0006875273 /DNA_START=447 /DNA_END=1184 /DNA_ORIENTATION=+
MTYGIISPLRTVCASASGNDAGRRHTRRQVHANNSIRRTDSKTTNRKSTVKTQAFAYKPSLGGNGGNGSFFSGGNGGNGGNIPRKKTDSGDDEDGHRYIARGALMTAGVLGCADGLSQALIERKSTFDYKRMLRLVVFGLIIKGPLMTMFYRVLDATFPGTAIRTVASKLLVDQGPFSWIINSMMLFILPLMEGHCLNTAYKKTYDNIVPMQITAYKIWPAVHMFNYAFVPPAARIVFVNTAGLVW